MIKANDPALRSWVDVKPGSDFPIQNLPFGIFSSDNLKPRVGVAIGDYILDLKTLHVLGYLKNQPFELSDFDTDSLNSLMSYGKMATRYLRNRLSELLRSDNPELRSHEHHVGQALVPMNQATLHLPIKVGDYTDFYSSREHATNVGMMFRDPANALLPNWLHLPVGYHGRAGSIVVSGTPIIRPKGQTMPDGASGPLFGPTRQLDFELEMAFITYSGKPLGQSISTAEAPDYIFGMVMFNDWSARDIQKWEYVPLGPFLGKNFASSMSPWVVTLDALEAFRQQGPVQEPEVLAYLKCPEAWNFDIDLEVRVHPKDSQEHTVCHSNTKYLYWNICQQLAHHTINGCSIRCGDLMASGTISGPEEGSFGSMLEIAWKGTKPVAMPDGTERKFILDLDTVSFRAIARNKDYSIGFGELRNEVLPAYT
jgi:fumarylacetoacetase